MTTSTSISLTDAQAAYAQSLVERGDYSTVSAVLQRGLDLLRRENERAETDLELMRRLINERRNGPFITMDEAEAQTLAMLERKRAAIDAV